MPSSIHHRNTPAVNPKNAVQQRARRHGKHCVSADQIPQYRNKAEGLLGFVLIFDRAGNQLAGPFSVTDADDWLTVDAYTRAIGGAS